MYPGGNHTEVDNDAATVVEEGMVDMEIHAESLVSVDETEPEDYQDGVGEGERNKEVAER